MKKQRSLIRTLKWILLLVAFLPLLILTLVVVVKLNSNHSDRISKLRERFLTQSRASLELEVEKAVDFIGFQTNHSDISSDVTDRILQQMSVFRFLQSRKSSGYLFVVSYQGEVLRGDVLSGITEPHLEAKNTGRISEFHEQLMEAILKKRNGHFHTRNHINESTKPETIYTYVKEVPEMEWIVGGSFSDEKTKYILSRVETRQVKRLRRFIGLTTFIAILFLAVIVAIDGWIIRKLTSNFGRFQLFFKEAANGSVKIESGSLDFTEFDEMANAANQMIVDRKRIEEKLIYAKETAESANLAKSDFLANISHELRTPMHAILNYSDFGVRKSDTISSEKRLFYYSQINKAAERLMKLINDLLDLSKIESGTKIVKFVKCSLSTIANSAISEVAPFLKEKGMSIELTDSLDEHQKMVCDEFRIGQVFSNLLTNAIEFSPTESVIYISIAYSTITGFVSDKTKTVPAVLVQVKDSGVGIPSDELELVFDPFTLSSLTKTGAGGKGLGLAICREIVNSHGGVIWADNNPEGGALFSFKLPIDSSQSSTIQLPLLLKNRGKAKDNS